MFNASTYTALQWFKPNSGALAYNELDRDLTTNVELKKYLDTLCEDNFSHIDQSKLTEDTWVLTNDNINHLLDILNKQPRRVENVFSKIFQGLATSKDDVYFLQDCNESGNLVTGYSNQLERTVQIEKGLVRPLLKGEDVHRYEVIKTNRVVIFPYKLVEGKAVLYEENELKGLFPNGYSYLKECETVLRNREKGHFNIDGAWFQFGRKQGISSAEEIKLVAPDISMGGNFALDIKGQFYQTTTIYGYIKYENVKCSYKSLLALLNSHLCCLTGPAYGLLIDEMIPDWRNSIRSGKTIPDVISTEIAIPDTIDNAEIERISARYGLTEYLNKERNRLEARDKEDAELRARFSESTWLVIPNNNTHFGFDPRMSVWLHTTPLG